MTLATAMLPCEIVIELAATNYGGIVPDNARHGIMLHYDASKTDTGAQNWFQSPAFKLSYSRAYTDSGRRIQLAPVGRRAFHAGVCKKTTLVRDANAAFYGLCVTAGDGQPANAETNAVVTMPQFTAIVEDAATIGRYHQLIGHREFATDRIDTWLTGHNEWAVYPNDHPRAGQFGRKVDPRGTQKAYDVLPINSARQAVATLLDSPTHDLWQRVRFT